MKTFLLDSKFCKNEKLSKHNSIKIGGICDYYFEPNSIKEFVNIIKLCLKSKTKFFILGNGTKVIFSDKGFRGVVICTKKLKQISSKKRIVCCDCGTNMFTLNKYLIEQSFCGLEFSYGIPGTIGGAVFMNAGAYGDEIGNFVHKVQVLDGTKIKTIKGKNLKFEYRNSFVRDKKYIVLKVWLKLNKGEKSQIKKKCDEYFTKRKITQPLETYNCGSIFKKTNNIIAGKIIDNLGLKGVTINGAQISTVHANFIINKSNATQQDVKDLMDFVKQKVFEDCGVWLEEEVILVGDK